MVVRVFDSSVCLDEKLCVRLPDDRAAPHITLDRDAVEMMTQLICEGVEFLKLLSQPILTVFFRRHCSIR